MYRFLEHLIFPPTFFKNDKLARQLVGKTVLITGASSGIGEQLAYLLADIDVHLILVARRTERLLAIKEKVEIKTARVSVVSADLRNKADLESLLHYLHALPAGLDVVISNAGHSIKRSLNESLDRFHDFSRTMAINYSGPVQLFLSVIPLLKQKKGHIINVSTVNVLIYPFPDWAAYQASKAAFDTWLLSSAPELKAMGICTTSIYLPLVRTPMILPTASYAKMPAMSPQHVAKIIGKCMYTRNTYYKPWWLIFAQLSSTVFRKWIEKSLYQKLRKESGKHENI